MFLKQDITEIFVLHPQSYEIKSDYGSNSADFKWFFIMI